MDVPKIENCLKINKLTLNPDKTINMTFNKKIIIEIKKIKSEIIDVKMCLYTKHLGIHLDAKSDFKFRIEFCQKTNNFTHYVRY